MSLSHSPKITTNGLIFIIDPANPKCFNNGDTTCVNMVTGGLVTGANGQPNAGTHTPDTANFPTYNSEAGGVFDFVGGKGMNVEENLGSHSTLTLEMWYYKNSASAQYFTDGRNDGGNWFLSSYTSANLNYTSALTYNFDTTYDAGNPAFVDRWQHMVITSDAGGSKLYIDGTERTLIGSTSIDEDIGKNFRIGTRYTTGTEWTGKMGAIRIYNRVVSAAEAAQNFNALRGRYGI